MKRKIKIAVDVLMFAAFCYLTGYHPGAGVLAHGIVGITLFALFIAHHLLNLGWYKALPKGSYTPMRVLFVVVNFAFLADMILMAASSVLMSELVFASSPFHSTQFARSLHVMSSAWGFVLMSLHVGLHTHAPLSKLSRKCTSKAARILYAAFCLIVFIVGIICLAKSGVLGKLIGKTSWLAFGSRIVFYAQLLVAVASACIFMHWLMSALVKVGRKRQKPSANLTLP